MRIERVDVADDQALRAWYEAWAEGSSAGRDDPSVWTLPELTVTLRTPEPAYRHEAYAAMDSGETLGGAMLELPTIDNTDLAELAVNVPPAHRGKGVGRVSYDRVAARAAELGRTSLCAELSQPLDGVEIPGAAFARHRGFTLRNTEIRRRLDLPVPRDRLDALAAHAARRCGDYLIRVWQGPCPDEYAEQYAELKAFLSTKAPMGGLRYEQERWDVDRLRSSERQTAAQDRTLFTAVAVAPDGALAGHTQLAVPTHDPGRAYQWDTLVLREHQGHRLGLAVKVVNLRAMTEAFPERTTVQTYNAEQNGPMVAVNDALGFDPVERLEEWQRG